jgi:hypothetical protein
VKTVVLEMASQGGLDPMLGVEAVSGLKNESSLQQLSQ